MMEEEELQKLNEYLTIAEYEFDQARKSTKNDDLEKMLLLRSIAASSLVTARASFEMVTPLEMPLGE